jgi:hypothetical protein
LIADGRFNPASGPTTTSLATPRIVDVNGATVNGVQPTDHFLSREGEHRTSAVGPRERELRDLAAVYLGHRWAPSTRPNSSGCTGVRAYASCSRRTASSRRRRSSQSRSLSLTPRARDSPSRRDRMRHATLAVKGGFLHERKEFSHDARGQFG